MIYRENINKITIFFVFIGLLLPSFIFGKSFIWEIKTKNKNSSYLIGSVHMLDKSVYPLDKAFDIAFQKSDCLMVEANVSDDQRGKLQMLSMKLATYKGEKTLKGSISEETYNLAGKKLKEFGIDITGWNKFKPWMVAMTIAASEMMKLGFDPNLGIDKYFLNKAGEKEIIELEGAEFQLNLFDSFSDEEHELFLFNVLTEETNTEVEFKKLVNAWKTGNDDTLNTLVNQNIKKYPKLKNLYEKLIDGRNFGMVKKIDDFIKTTSKRYFVVVGAAHLVGENGLVNLLKKKGYMLKQL